MEIYKILKEHNAKGEQRAMKTKEIMAITGMSQREVGPMSRFRTN